MQTVTILTESTLTPSLEGLNLRTLWLWPFSNTEVNLHKVSYASSYLLTCFHRANTWGSTCTNSLNNTGRHQKNTGDVIIFILVLQRLITVDDYSYQALNMISWFVCLLAFVGALLKIFIHMKIKYKERRLATIMYGIILVNQL